MTRRARRRKARHGNRISIVLGAGLLLLMAALALVFFGVKNYLHSEAFRRFLSNKASEAVGIRGQFTPLRWDGFAVKIESFAGSGTQQVRELQVNNLQTEIQLGAVRRGVWELSKPRARKLRVKLDLREPSSIADASNAPQASPAPKPSSKKSDSGGWLPNRIEIGGLAIDEIQLEAETRNGQIAARGIRLEAEPGDSPESFRGTLRGGNATLPFSILPELRLDRARFQANRHGVVINDLRASGLKSAQITADGDWDPASGRLIIEGLIDGVQCEEILDETWSRRLSGTLSSTAVFEQRNKQTRAHGRIVLENGMLTALPVLDVLAAYLDTRRFRTLVMSEAHTDWKWQNERLELENIVLANESQLRLEGNLNIHHRNLDGNFMLGVAPGTLASVPGAETVVFRPGPRGLLWAPLKLSGTLDDPKEDLSDRLIMAAGMRILEILPESGEKVLKFSRNLLGETPQEAIEQGTRILDEGTRIIDEGSRAIREVDSLFDRILGGPRNEPQDHEDEAQ